MTEAHVTRSSNARTTLKKRIKATMNAPFLREISRDWTLRELISLSESLEKMVGRRISSPILGIGVRAVSNHFAALFYAWRNELIPVLFDPESPTDADRLISLQPKAFVMYDQPGQGGKAENSLVIPEDILPVAGKSGDIIFPGDSQPLVGFLTSGSTGAPKVVIKKGYQIYRQLEIMPDILALPNQFKTVCMVPFYHILGFMYGFLLPLCYGGLTRNSSEMVPVAMRDLLLDEKPGLVVGTAVQYRLLETIWEPGTFLGETLFMSSGAPLDWTVARRFAEKTGTEILEMYGSTETGGCAHRFGNDSWQSYPGVEFRIEPETFRLHIRSPWSESPDMWITSHDLAEPVENGFRLLGRDGSLAKIGGKRFSTREVEEAIKEHPHVSDAVVLIAERDNAEPALHAFVAILQGTKLVKTELRTFLTDKLAHFKIPRTLHFQDELPRTKLNKINYAALRKELGQSHNSH